MVRVDHIIVAVPDLSASIEAWRLAGLNPAAGGSHPGGTSNALIRGPEPGYLELICAGVGGDETTARVRESRGPLSWALSVDDIDSARAHLLERGFSPGQVRAGSRTTPRGETFAWRLCDIARSPLHPFTPFLIEWEVGMEPGPVGGPRLREIVVETPSPADTIRVLTACGLAVVIESPEAGQLTDDIVTIHLRPGVGSIREVTVAMPHTRSQELTLDGLRLRLEPPSRAR